ncbi:MAG TPA: hypothetical protein VHD58_03195 [Mycobacteriales bacterium]|nr:hypothetical protein [Mycobacteriales bacterium]
MKRKGDEDEVSFAGDQATTRDEYVGRAGADESGDAGQSGAERRAEAEDERAEEPSSRR